MSSAFNLTWDKSGEHIYETGVKMGVLYVVTGDTGAYGKGVAWNGLATVTESPSGAEASATYADDIKYLNLYSAEEFGATIEAYSYPEEFSVCNGESSLAKGVTIGQQDRRTFGLCYRTVIGNDIMGDNYGYKLHFIYGAKAAPSERAYTSINDSPEPITLSWELSTVPVSVNGYKATSYICIDSTKCDAKKLEALEKIIYGTAATSESANDGVDARLPLPDEIATLMAAE